MQGGAGGTLGREIGAGWGHGSGREVGGVGGSFGQVACEEGIEELDEGLVL